MQTPLLVLTNLPDMQTAQAMARALVDQHLAACVNILPAVHSVYRWQGAVEEADEVTLLIKTQQVRYAELEAAIKSVHPYELPEIIALPTSGGLPQYLAWIAQETKKNVDV
ncbi:divalent-cation tolerance protein CutA [Noviherbaspirillum massiliense]|uniref:divalent-cation tolerance protein CutA n=1 Tax=Noviherbaspirillum massiliense TaxID=1465823 RepID=UPI0002D4D8CE|nr:divalent-cation tolerance protein CutA [Noviherbaspirillum massiliense]